MAMTTVHIGTRRSRALPVGRFGAHAPVVETLRLVALAALVGILGPLAIAAVAGLTVAAISGSPVAAGNVASLGLPFIAITAPTMAVWLIGAIQTRRVIRRSAARFAKADRAAFAELDVLLARER